jgi:hypothetical protein
MRTMNVIIVSVVALVLVVVGTGFVLCGGWRAIATRYEDDASSPAAISEIRVTGKTVAVQVRPGAGPGVEIHRTARYLNPTHARPASTHRIEGSVLYLGGDDGCTMCVIEYVVTLPAGARISADIGTGSLDVAGVSSVEAKVSTGAIRIADATGNVTARTDTGEIKGTGLRSDTVVAVAGTGAVSLELVTPADVEATAGTGSVAVIVPADTYRVEASTGMGKLNVGIADDPNGRHRLVVRSKMGEVTLATR